LKIFEEKPETPSAGPARYSQPLPSTTRDARGPIVRAGFVGKGADKQPGFIFYNRETAKVEQVEATTETKANEHPRGFFQSLARMMFGGKP
jgi:hypothetical protein